MKILLVEDEVDLAEVVILNLEMDDHDVTHVISVTDAVSNLKSAKYDVALLDMNVKGGTAREIIDQVGDIKLGTKIFVVTGEAREEVEKQMGQQIHGVVSKPYRFDELKTIIEN